MVKRRLPILSTLTLVLALVGAYVAYAWAPLAVEDDPLVRMPGTQPTQVSLEAPGRCLNCHAGYNQSVEPGYNWKGSMMAQASRDFLFWACLTVAAQDSIWAVGTPNAVDICERCHFPKGWLEGRSDPPNVSLMTGADFDGVQCDFCHRMVDPFFETTYQGTREGSDWVGYWDETNASDTPSQQAADAAYAEDMAQAQSILHFNGSSFFTNNLPPATYRESGAGQYFVSGISDKRASFADAAARHQMLYSRYHKSKYFCDTCHDVSNPVLANLGQDGTLPLTTETESAYSYYHVERTFSEFMLSAYGQPGGAPGMGPFAPDVFETSDASNNIAMCQDCHMRDVVGEACNKNGVPIRPNDSTEHPNSGQPLHDLTGGNVWVSWVLASAVPGSPNHDPTNDTLLNPGPAALTLDLTQGEGIDPQALLAGADRARQQLQLAASIQNLNYSASNGSLSFRIQNQTGHKLISGFPEGRRMFVNIKAYAGNDQIYEVNPYDAGAGTLKGLIYPYDGTSLRTPCDLGSSYNPDTNSCEPLTYTELHLDELVYEMKPTVDLTPAGINYVEEKSFHFALATSRYKDNRIPPKEFDIGGAAARMSVPVWHGVESPSLFSAAEYAGGYDDVSLTIAADADRVEVSLYYQTTSREYVEFLRDEINGDQNQTLPSEAYVSQTDAFFNQLGAWGNTIWNLWTHNMDIDGAKPVPMAQAAVGTAPEPCLAPTPSLISATPGNQQVTVSWSDEHSTDSNVAGYNLYYDQAGKAQFLANAGLTTTFLATGLTNGQEYCYKVTTYYAPDCESAFSNVLCAVPNNQGQARVGVSAVETGRYEITGKGKNKVTTFVLTGAFARGDGVVVRAHVVDANTGLPVANATVEIEISGPESVILTTGPSDGSGIAEAIWQTQAPNKRGQGGTTPGSYTAAVRSVVAAGYTWDGVMTSTTFTIE